jgi:hypothetical protein
MPIRTISYQFTTGRIPYALVYKIHLVTGVPMIDLVPKYLAENWLFLFEEQNKSNKPRGKQKSWRPGDNDKQAESELSKKPEEKQQKIKAPAEKIADVPRGTPEVTDSGIPKSVTPKKKSIADIMKEAPKPPEPPEEGAPDFSNIPDELFSTSMDQIPKSKRR